eukprot:1424815-Amphidinium_carterae.1
MQELNTVESEEAIEIIKHIVEYRDKRAGEDLLSQDFCANVGNRTASTSNSIIVGSVELSSRHYHCEH